MIKALRGTELPPDDPAPQKAAGLHLLAARTSGASSTIGPLDPCKVNNEGFIYTAANGASSVAGKTDDLAGSARTPA